MIEFFCDDYGPSGRVLACPGCGNGNLHHLSLNWYHRDEDAKYGVHLRICEDGTSSTDWTLAGNPSDRRGGFKVEFMCELCDAVPVLEVAQHKGATLVRWSYRRSE